MVNDFIQPIEQGLNYLVFYSKKFWGGLVFLFGRKFKVVTVIHSLYIYSYKKNNNAEIGSKFSFWNLLYALWYDINICSIDKF